MISDSTPLHCRVDSYIEPRARPVRRSSVLIIAEDERLMPLARNLPVKVSECAPAHEVNVCDVMSVLDDPAAERSGTWFRRRTASPWLVGAVVYSGWASYHCFFQSNSASYPQRDGL